MALPNFENEEWKYTDVYDRSVLHGPVAFPKLRKLWKLGRIGPGTTVSNGTWLPRPVPVKRVKGLMTALSKKGDPGGVAPRGVSANTDDVDWAATGSGIEEQLWYCQMPNREVVGPLKTRTLQRLWLRGKVEGTYLVRAKSSSTWPSDRTYTVEGLMQALKVFHTNPVHGIDAGMGTPPPQVPSSLASSVRRKGHGAGMAVQSSPISAIQEVVITLPHQHAHHHHQKDHHHRSTSRRGGGRGEGLRSPCQWRRRHRPRPRCPPPSSPSRPRR